MKIILKILTLSLFINSAVAATLYPSLSLLNDGASKQLHMGTDDGELSFLTTSQLAISTTTIASPMAGLIIFADGDNAYLDLDNEHVLDLLENIEISLSDGVELTDLEKAILNIGYANNQINIDGTIK